MLEKLDIYNLKGKFLESKDRKLFYTEIRKEFAEKGKISRKIKSIRLLLMNSTGRTYLQKRSNNKNENPGIYDKTVGGHVSEGDTFGLTVIKECAEELGFPATILPQNEFLKAIKVTNLEIIGIFQKVDYIETFLSERIAQNGTKFIQPFINESYIGYYNGAIRFVDGESSGIEVFSLSELKKEIKDNPQKFTEDVKFMVKKYERYLKPIT